MKKVSLNWKEVAEAIGILAIVMSLYFVGLQVQQATIIAEIVDLLSSQGSSG